MELVSDPMSSREIGSNTRCILANNFHERGMSSDLGGHQIFLVVSLHLGGLGLFVEQVRMKELPDWAMKVKFAAHMGSMGLIVLIREQ